MNRTETLRFLLVGLSLVVIGLVVFGMAMPITGAMNATFLRLLVVVPLLYLGYTRYVLKELLVAEKVKYGALRAELHMAGRVTASMGASIGIKLLLEPPVSQFLETVYGQKIAYLSPLLADFVYGPVANYLVLAYTSRKANR